MFLLDTNVVSELRKPRPHGAVLAWLHGVDDRNLYVSAVTIGEIQAGIELTRPQNEEKASELESWLDLVAASWNVLPMGTTAFRTWARLMRDKPDALYEDAMIAATALVHHLTVVTRNVRDFALFNVSVLNPFRLPRR